MSEEMSELHELDQKYILKLEAKVAELEGTLSNQECDTAYWQGRAENLQTKVKELEALAGEVSDNAHCKKHFINYCPELSKECPYCRIAESQSALNYSIVARQELEAKVKELEGQAKELIHDLHAYMDTANAELNRAEKAEAKVAELEATIRRLCEATDFDVLHEEGE